MLPTVVTSFPRVIISPSADGDTCLDAPLIFPRMNARTEQTALFSFVVISRTTFRVCRFTISELDEESSGNAHDSHEKFLIARGSFSLLTIAGSPRRSRLKSKDE